MSINKGRFAAVVLAVGAIALGMTGAANAATVAKASPGHSIGEAWVGGAAAAAVPAPIPATKGAVTNYYLGKGAVYGDNLGPGMVSWFTTVYNGSVHEIGLDANLKAKVNDKTGQVTELEADGPYPGSTKLQDHPGQGANSTAKVPADGKSHAVWVMCADGKTALGGGYRVAADQGDAVASKIQVTASEPTQVVKDGDTYKVAYAPIAGDAAGSIEPNGWLVEAINAGDTDATVRPWVTCAKVAK